jgi:hypothetical protein
VKKIVDDNIKYEGDKSNNTDFIINNNIKNNEDDYFNKINNNITQYHDDHDDDIKYKGDDKNNPNLRRLHRR